MKTLKRPAEKRLASALIPLDNPLHTLDNSCLSLDNLKRPKPALQFP